MISQLTARLPRPSPQRASLLRRKRQHQQLLTKSLPIPRQLPLVIRKMLNLPTSQKRSQRQVMVKLLQQRMVPLPSLTRRKMVRLLLQLRMPPPSLKKRKTQKLPMLPSPRKRKMLKLLLPILKLLVLISRPLPQQLPLPPKQVNLKRKMPKQKKPISLVQLLLLVKSLLQLMARPKEPL